MIVPIDNRSTAIKLIDYCSSNISPRLYYLHNSSGGSGWRVHWEDRWKTSGTTRAGWILELEDESHFTFIALKFGL